MPTETAPDGPAPQAAHHVATVAAPLDPASADTPQVLHLAGRQLLVQRGDMELAVRDLGGVGTEVRFPAPWPRPFGTVTVSPGGDLAVFAGVHALRAVDATGSVRWEIRHGCWSTAVCEQRHVSYTEYADDFDHTHADHGSAAFSPDGKLVWAHVRDSTGDGLEEEWLVLDAVDGTVLGRAETGTVASGSFQYPHPDPAYMGLTVGEGEEDSPVLWGHFDGTTLTVRRFPGEVLLGVSPSGGHFLTTDPEQWSLYLHRAADGTELGRLDAEDTVPVAPGSADDDRARWDYEAAYVAEGTVVIGTDTDVNAYATRHWLVDVAGTTLRGRVSYPFPVSGPARPAGEGTWYTVSADETAVHLWRRAEET
ncbi:hypothetical protein ACWCQN_05635 [Streptomyces sp. NPDC001984]